MLFSYEIRNSVIVLLVIIGAALLIFLFVTVSRPLTFIKKVLHEYQQTKDAEAVVEKLSRVHSKTEIGLLSDEFSALATEMARYTDEVARLAGERERVATELKMASAIQMGMLPKDFPDREDFTLYASIEPAKEVGGDFYDFYMLDDDHLVLTIADVSGKGMPAALFMAVSRSILKSRSLLGGTPADILYDANNQLCEGNKKSLFVTVWHAILTLSTGELVSANAGHNYPCMRLGDSPFKHIKDKHGFVMGSFKGLQYTNNCVQLSPGDTIFVYTDGVTEATAEDDSMFYEHRLEEVLQSTDRNDSPEAIIAAVKNSVNSFVGDAPQCDDITMLAFVYKGKTK